MMDDEKTLTLAEARRRADAIRGWSDLYPDAADDHYADSLVICFQRDVLRAIARGACEAPAECARVAIDVTGASSRRPFDRQARK
jgi:hypothetical protein